MIRLANTEQMRMIDHETQQLPNMSEKILIQTAGRLCANWIEKNILSKHSLDCKILFVLGPGNNGQDGKVVFQHISKKYSNCDVLCSDTTKFIAEIVNAKPLQSFTKKYDVIIDAIFGIGINKNISGTYLDCIQSINKNNATVISLDMPSGINSDTGNTMGINVQANITLCMGLAKIGNYVNTGAIASGKRINLNPGFPTNIIKKHAQTFFKTTASDIKKYRPRFNYSTNKSKRGHSLIIAGSEQYQGAAVLSALAALRTGSGYVTVANSNPLFSALENPDFLIVNLENRNLHDLKFNAVAIGPGLGVNAATASWIKDLMQLKIQNVVVDADAITACVKYNLFPLPPTWTITPHAGELSRILNIPAEQIENNRFEYALKASQQTGCMVLLKGFHSILATKNKCIVIPTGNSALAKSGTGDVLTGMICSFLAQGAAPYQAVLSAAYIHGKIADLWVKNKKDPASFIASDLLRGLPSVLKLF